MKMAALIALAAVAGVANADVTYTDSSNDLFNNGFDHLDITSVVVGHDATNLYFTVNVRGSLDASAWGKYCIGINTPGGVNSSGNGWARPISWGGQGIDYWVGSWADDGGNNFGGEVRQMLNAGDNSNNLLAATYGAPGLSGSSIGTQQMFTVSRALLGLGGNDTFTFDVISSGGGSNDPGVDHLSRADQATPDWSVASTAGAFSSYTIPTPGTVALLGMGALALVRRRR